MLGGGRRWHCLPTTRRPAGSETRLTATYWRTKPTSSPARLGSWSRCRPRGPSGSRSVRKVRRTIGSSTSPVWTTDGLLARLADALTSAGCDIAAATVATWPDGAVVDTFLVRAAVRPPAKRLAGQIEHTLNAPIPSPAAIVAVDVQFDNDAAPWHTTCTITGRDRPGMLVALAGAFAVAGVTVHSARLTSARGQLADRFAFDRSRGAEARSASDGRRHRRARRCVASTPAASDPLIALVRERTRTQQRRNTLVLPRKPKASQLALGSPRAGASRSMDLEPGRADAWKRVLKYALGGTAGALFVTLFGGDRRVRPG